jgi:hypothetical protein
VTASVAKEGVGRVDYMMAPLRAAPGAGWPAVLLSSVGGK